MKILQKSANDRKQALILFLGIIVCSGIFGWIYETLFYMYNYDGLIVKRGSCFGPWLDIYCLGGVLIYFACRKLTGKPWLVFLVSGALCGALEYAAGFLMDRINGGNYGWDYNTEKLNFGNINGYVCLRSVLVFALAGLLLFYGIIPMLKWFQRKIGEKAYTWIIAILGTVVLLDIAYNDIVAGIFGLPSAPQIYSSLGWFSPTPG